MYVFDNEKTESLHTYVKIKQLYQTTPYSADSPSFCFRNLILLQMCYRRDEALVSLALCCTGALQPHHRSSKTLRALFELILAFFACSVWVLFVLGLIYRKKESSSLCSYLLIISTYTSLVFFVHYRHRAFGFSIIILSHQQMQHNVKYCRTAA